MYAEAIPAGVGSVNAEILEYFKVVGTLAVIVVVAFVGLRFWLPKLNGIGGNESGPMHVVSRLTLEPRKILYIVRAGSEYVLVASSDAGVQLLTSLDTGQIEAALQESALKPATGFDFASLLRGRRAQPAERLE